MQRQRRRVRDYEKAVNASCLSSYVPLEDVEKELVCETTPEELLIRKQILVTASDEAKKVVALILSTPPNIMESLCCAGKPYHFSGQRVKRYLQMRLGMTRSQVDIIFHEIKLRLSFS